jgi:Holliday junction resolvase RusA-like endonuclease
MKEVEFTVPGVPMGKQRPRHGNGTTYTPTKTVNYETFIKEIYATEVKQMLTGPLSLTVIAFFPIPKGTSKKKQQMMLDNEIGHTKKPDIDNILKIVMDALNSIAYTDDSQITSISGDKLFSDKPRLEVHIYQQTGE